MKMEKKLVAVGVSGAVATLLIAGLNYLGVTLGPEEGAAIAVIIAFLFGYLKRN